MKQEFPLEITARKCASDIKQVKGWKLWPHSETPCLSYAVGVICHWWSRLDSVPGEGRDVQYTLVYQGVELASVLVCTAFISWRWILPK